MSEHPTDAHFLFTFVFKQALIYLLKSMLRESYICTVKCTTLQDNPAPDIP